MKKIKKKIKNNLKNEKRNEFKRTIGKRVVRAITESWYRGKIGPVKLKLLSQVFPENKNLLSLNLSGN